jgi:rhodanese-related sulfurtransferase
MESMIENVTVQELAAAIERGEPVVDVRTPDEYASGHVPTAVLVPMHTIPARVEDLRAQTPVYLICEVGSRSWRVGEFLAQFGIATRNVSGGTSQWRELGWPLEYGDAPAD